MNTVHPYREAPCAPPIAKAPRASFVDRFLFVLRGGMHVVRAAHERRRGEYYAALQTLFGTGVATGIILKTQRLIERTDDRRRTYARILRAASVRQIMPWRFWAIRMVQRIVLHAVDTSSVFPWGGRGRP